LTPFFGLKNGNPLKKKKRLYIATGASTNIYVFAVFACFARMSDFQIFGVPNVYSCANQAPQKTPHSKYCGKWSSLMCVQFVRKELIGGFLFTDASPSLVFGANKKQ
jgi:hypothetical protein